MLLAACTSVSPQSADPGDSDTVPSTTGIAPEVNGTTGTTATTGTTGSTIFLPQLRRVTGTQGDLPVEVFAPAEPGPYPVVVTVHGGGWVGGSPDYMAPLADALAAEGVVVFNVTYHTMRDDGRFPDMVEDVACGVAYARDHAADYTTTYDDVYIAGHSAGAHLAALVALAPETFTCPGGGTASPDGLIGLAGPYDTDRIAILSTFFGATLEEDPDAWAAGNPLTYVNSVPDIPILLIHGDADDVVPISFTEQLEEALAGAGANLDMETLPGGTHPDAADPEFVTQLITEFMEG
jgi:acetyl esterase/lipase